MNNLNATIGLTQMERYKENLLTRKKNYDTLKLRYNLLDHDNNSSYYFATTLVDQADQIIEKTGFVRNYPMLHKTSFYSSGCNLSNLESIHSKILNLPLTRGFDGW